MELFEAASVLAVAQWANHQVATQTPHYCTVETQNTDSVRVGEGYMENIPQWTKQTQTYKTSL